MRRANSIICMILMVHAVSLAGQSRSDMHELFVSAEGDLLFEDYPEALPKYLSLLQIYPEKYDTSLVRFRMQTCNNARIMMRTPVSLVDADLGGIVSESLSGFNPVISADEKTLLFTLELQFYDDIVWSRKIDGKWTEPESAGRNGRSRSLPAEMAGAGGG